MFIINITNFIINNQLFLKKIYLKYILVYY